MNPVIRKQELARRSVARRPLAVLLQWIVVRAVRPYLGAEATPWMIEAIVADIQRILLEMSDAGAFLYFGIRNSEEMGVAPVKLWMRSDLLLQVEAVELVDWIMGGGAGGAGWRSTSDLDLNTEVN